MKTLFLFFVFSVLFLGSGLAYAATPNQCIALRAAGYTGPCNTATPIGPTEEALLELNKGKESAYAFLADHKTKGANTAQFDPEFAKAIKAFMEDTYKETGHMPIITDGYRGAAAQDRAARSGASGVGAGGSPHNYGMAADFNGGEPKQVIAWMRAYAGSTRTNQEANHNIRTIGDSYTGCDLTAANGRSFCDPNHFELATWRSVSGARSSRYSPSTPDQGLFSSLLNKLRPQQPFPNPIAPYSAIPIAPQEILKSVFGTPTPIPPPTTPFASTTTKSIPIKTSEEKIVSMTVVAPPAMATSTTHPIKKNALVYLNEQKVSLKPPIPIQARQPTVYYADRHGIKSVVGFSSDLPSRAVSGATTYDTFRTAYKQILARIELALREILRMLRNEPSLRYYPEEQWTRYN